MKFKNNIYIEPATVQVYSVSVEKNRHILSEYISCLSVDEKDKADRYKFQIDRERFIIARGILRILSGNYLNLSPNQIRFEYSEYGKPDYAPEQSLKFNISHSGDIIVLAFAHENDLGVDVELIKTDFDPLKLAQNFFSKTEIDALKKVPKKDLSKAFFRCWTRKESFIKAEGSGLSFPLNKFAVSMDTDENAELLKTDWDFSERLNWSLFSFIPNEQYIGALAVRNKRSRIKYFDWDVITQHSKPTSE